MGYHMARSDQELSLLRLVEKEHFRQGLLDWLIHREHITRLDELTQFTRTELLGMPGIGPGTLAQLEAVMAKHELFLAPGTSNAQKTR